MLCKKQNKTCLKIRYPAAESFPLPDPVPGELEHGLTAGDGVDGDQEPLLGQLLHQLVEPLVLLQSSQLRFTYWLLMSALSQTYNHKIGLFIRRKTFLDKNIDKVLII